MFRLCILAVPLVVAWMGAPAPAQDKEPPADATTVVTPAGEVRVLKDAEASQLVTRVKNLVLSKKALQGSKKPKKGKDDAGSGDATFLTRLEEMEALQKVQHKSLVPVLKQVLLKDPNDAVRIKAAEALAAQPKAPAVAVALECMQDRKFREAGSLAAPMIRLLSFHGAPKSFWKDMRQKFLEMGTVGQQAFLEHVGNTKDWDSLELLLENLDPPAPADVDGPNNPPAEYWKDRWEHWQGFKPQLHEALEKLLGQDFATAAEARTWIQEQGGTAKLRKERGG